MWAMRWPSVWYFSTTYLIKHTQWGWKGVESQSLSMNLKKFVCIADLLLVMHSLTKTEFTAKNEFISSWPEFNIFLNKYAQPLDSEILKNNPLMEELTLGFASCGFFL